VASPPPFPPRRPRAEPFTPRVTLSLLYLAGLVLLFGLLFALPDLLAAAREIPPGEGELAPEELARAREVARRALSGRIPWVFAASVVTFALALWRGLLPGLRRGRARTPGAG
jgi:hypothetical protein